MRYAPSLTQEAIEDLRSLEKKTASAILTKLRWFCEAPNPLHFAKPLSGRLQGLYRFRIGDYRAIFEMSPRGEVIVLQVLRVKHRKEVYE
jgi:mRNA interferase RelE/StbE